MEYTNINNASEALAAIGIDINSVAAIVSGYPENERERRANEYIVEKSIEAINGPDWKAYQEDNSTPKWLIVWENVKDETKASGRGLRFGVVCYVGVGAAVGPRLTFASEEKGQHAAKILHAEFEKYFLG